MRERLIGSYRFRMIPKTHFFLGTMPGRQGLRLSRKGIRTLREAFITHEVFAFSAENSIGRAVNQENRGDRNRKRAYPFSRWTRKADMLFLRYALIQILPLA